MRTLAGEQAQVDWAHFGHLQIGRAKRPLMGFVIVLSYSRRVFLRFCLNAQMDSFLRGHVEAFTAFGGLARILLYDNLKSVVLERVGDAIVFNPQFLAFAKHYRFEPRPVAVARGNQKGRVERQIDFIRKSFFAGRQFIDVEDLNAQALHWCEGRALDRPWPQDDALSVRSMQADGLITLPPSRSMPGRRMEPHFPPTAATDAQIPLLQPVHELDTLTPRLVTPPVSRLWNEYVQRCHYLGYTPLSGSQLRYNVFAGEQLVALLSFGASAWRLSARDRFIGWSELAVGGDPLPVHIQKTETNFAIGWQGHYQIDGDTFLWEDNDSRRLNIIKGYPLKQLLDVINKAG